MDKELLRSAKEIGWALAGSMQAGLLKNINWDLFKTARMLKKSGQLNAGSLFTLYSVSIPDRVALICNNEKVSYRELNSRMNKIGRALLSSRLRRGDRIILMVANSTAYVEMVGAVNKVGLSLVPVSTSLKAAELGYIMENSGAKGILFTDKYLKTIEGALEGARHVDPAKSIIVGEDPKKRFREYQQILATTNDQEPPVVSGDEEAPILLYTSGTTGKPKGAVRDLSNVNPIIFPLIMHDFNLTRDDVIFTPCPLYHAGPTAFMPLTLMVGGTFVIGEKFDIRDTLKNISIHNATLALMVPTHFQRLTTLPRPEFSNYNFSNLRGMISTGSHFTPTLKRKVSDIFGNKIYDLYGATEVGMALLARPGEVKDRPDTIGRPMGGVRIKLLDEKGNEVPQGEPGEVYVKGPATFEGYYHNKKATEECSHNGYITAGDVARQEEDGYYYMCDRKTDMIITGGVNVYPREVEDVLLRYPSIQDAAVLGAPSEAWGEVVVAFVQLAPKVKKPSTADIIDHAGQHLANFKKPKAVFFLKELPRNPQGKLLKKELKKGLDNGTYQI